MRAEHARTCAALVLVALPLRALAAVTVFAAASLGDVMTALDEAWQAQGEEALRISLAASSTLARQIELGAPADVFVSANIAWMDRLANEGELRAGSRRTVARNRLVLVAPSDADAVPGPVSVEEALAGLDARARIATGDPDHVPAGMYARAALESLGLWPRVAPRLARAADVRGALALVARGETPLGIVYETDARATKAVRIVATFPDASHPPIVYPAAVVRTSEAPEAAERVLDFLASRDARDVWHRFGFAPPSGL